MTATPPAAFTNLLNQAMDYARAGGEVGSLMADGRRYDAAFVDALSDSGWAIVAIEDDEEGAGPGLDPDVLAALMDNDRAVELAAEGKDLSR